MKTIWVLLMIACLCSHIVADDEALAAALTQTGAKLALAGKTEQAEQVLYRALAYDPKCAAAYFELGKMAEKNGDGAEAFGYYLKVESLSIDTMKAEALRRRASLDQRLDKVLRSLSDYAASVAKIESSFGPLAIERANSTITALGISRPAKNRIQNKPGPIDLLAALGESLDVYRGQCAFKNGVLTCGGDNGSVDLHHRVLGEYDLVIDMTPVSGSHAVVKLSYEGRDFHLGFGIENPSFQNRTISLKRGSKTSALIQIRKSSFSVFIDGVKVADGSPASIYRNPYWSFGDPSSVGVASHDSVIRFSRIEILEIRGKDTK